MSSLRKARLWQIAAIALVSAVVLGILVFTGLVAWVSGSLPNPNSIQRQEGAGTKITDRNGEVLYDVYANEQWIPVAAENTPEYLKQATVAIEDKDFYKHGGFDPLTPVRIVYNAIVNHRLVGGSTLTQQLVKKSVLSDDRTVIRKLKELILAVEIERKYSKDEILQMYLNQVPYGGTAIGVGAASQEYFGKDPADLTLVESAILAGLPQRPTAYSPLLGQTDDNGVELWKIRTRSVLSGMKDQGYINDDLYKQALDQLDSQQFASNHASIKAPHFVFYVQDQLNNILGEDRANQGGLQVTTTLDLPSQDQAQDIVKEEVDKVTKLKISNGAALVMDPNNGQILAMVGSKDYFASDIPGQFNVAVNGLRQPGSSIKPVTYATAFKQGMTPATVFVDAFTTFQPNDQIKAYEPKNYDGKFHGPLSIRQALATSDNVVAVKTLATVGVQNMLSTAFDMGFPTLEPTKENMSKFGLSVTLGGGEVHLIDTVSAYSAFANQGLKVQPVSILEIKDSQGKTLYKYQDVPGKRVLTPEETYLIDSILSDNAARAPEFGTNSQLNFGGKPIAVKTGTTNDQKDNWTIGWSRSTIVGVWVGNNDNSSMTNVASGITGAAPIWHRIMQNEIDSGRGADAWAVPDGVEQAQVDPVSGYPPHDDLGSAPEWIIKGSLPTGADPIHQKLKLCNGENKLATAADIQRGNFHEQTYTVLRENDPVSEDGENRWQDGINAWISQQPDNGKYLAPTDLCGTSDDLVITMDSPKDQTKYDSEDVNVSVNTFSETPVDRVEIYVNGNLQETLKDKPYQTTMHLSKGQYHIYAKAIRSDGKTSQTGEISIGTGGSDYQNQPSPQPSPMPTPMPSPLI